MNYFMESLLASSPVLAISTCFLIISCFLHKKWPYIWIFWLPGALGTLIFWGFWLRAAGFMPGHVGGPNGGFAAMAGFYIGIGLAIFIAILAVPSLMAILARPRCRPKRRPLLIGLAIVAAYISYISAVWTSEPYSGYEYIEKEYANGSLVGPRSWISPKTAYEIQVVDQSGKKVINRPISFHVKSTYGVMKTDPQGFLKIRVSKGYGVVVIDNQPGVAIRTEMGIHPCDALHPKCNVERFWTDWLGTHLSNESYPCGKLRYTVTDTSQALPSANHEYMVAGLAGADGKLANPIPSGAFFGNLECNRFLPELLQRYRSEHAQRPVILRALTDLGTANKNLNDLCNQRLATKKVEKDWPAQAEELYRWAFPESTLKLTWQEKLLATQKKLRDDLETIEQTLMDEGPLDDKQFEVLWTIGATRLILPEILRAQSTHVGLSLCVLRDYGRHWHLSVNDLKVVLDDKNATNSLIAVAVILRGNDVRNLASDDRIYLSQKLDWIESDISGRSEMILEKGTLKECRTLLKNAQ